MRDVRTAAFALVFVNLVFMAWAHWIDVPLEPPVNQVDARLPRLVLAGEAPARTPPALKTAVPQAQPAPGEATSAALAPAAKRCVSVGPFNDGAQVTRAGSLLQERGFTPQQRSEDGDVRDGYWVYVAGIKSAADETRVLRSLQDAGISDARDAYRWVSLRSGLEPRSAHVSSSTWDFRPTSSSGAVLARSIGSTWNWEQATLRSPLRVLFRPIKAALESR